MITMMGITWIFGYFLLIPVNVEYETAMQWLFTIFNVFQVNFLIAYYTKYNRRPTPVLLYWSTHIKATTQDQVKKIGFVIKMLLAPDVNSNLSYIFVSLERILSL